MHRLKIGMRGKNFFAITCMDTPQTPAQIPSAPLPPPATGALLRNVVTVLCLLFLPPIGLIAVWTLAPWNRRARIVVTVLLGPFALYYPVLVMSTLIRAALR
jgi:hypothetical protein